MERRLLSFWQITRRRFKVPLTFMVLMAFGYAVNAQSYCTPTVTNQAYYYMGIVQFNMGAISNNTGQPNPNTYYNDYSGTFSAAFQAGDYVSYSVLMGQSNNTQVTIYIDWNQDRVFSQSELMSNTGSVNASNWYNGGFQLPASQREGVYRMRVVGDYGSAPANSPCHLNYTGEVEDYTFVVRSNSLDVVANDAPLKLEMGSNIITTAIGNVSPSTTVTSCEIGYRLDNGTVTTQNISGVNLSPLTATPVNFSTPLNISTPGVYTLKIWARNPNGTGAGIDDNDTIYRTLDVCYSLSGNYTINPSGSGPTNFTSFAAAIAKLHTCGVSGPVRFTVSPGTYNEQLEINSIDGASASNPVIFDGVNAASRTLSYNSTDANNRHVIRFNGASFVEFRNLTINATGSSYGWAVHMYSNTHNIRLAKNIIRTWDYNTTTGSTNFIPVVLANSATSYTFGLQNTYDIEIDSNTIQGGYIGVSCYGSGSNSGVYEVKVRNNRIENFYYFGTYMGNCANMQVEHNRISQRTSTTTGGYGIYMSGVYASGSYQTRVVENIIERSYQYGIYLNSVDNNSLRGLVANNITGQGLINVNAYGIYSGNSDNIDYWHNTILNPSATTNTDAAALFLNNSSGSDVRNNIFYANSVGATAYALHVSNASQISVLDYNNYYKVGADKSSPIIKIENDLFSANDLKGGGGFNTNSVSEAPLFLSQTDYHLSSIAASPFGEGSLGLTKDVDGNARCSLFPTIGADESTFISANNPQIFVDDTVFVDAPTRFFNSAAPGEPKKHSWDVNNGAATFSTLHITYTFNQAGTYAVKLETESCQGVATDTKQVIAVVPVVPPVSDFISSANNVDQGYTLNLVDQSTGGPSSWVWTITPAAGVQFTNGNTVQNPEVVFTETGSYEVCLTASNSAGQGNQICKTDYIQVTEANNMCASNKVSKTSSGKLFDAGGRFGDYSNGSNCGFLIDPCASSVTLSFTSFNVDLGDYLRVYDGSDANGTPLHTGAGFTGTIVPTDLTASTGKMYVQFVSNSTSTRSGFEASWTSVSKSFNAPVAAFRAPDTLYTGTDFTFISNSTGTDPEISWDFNGDDITDAMGEIASYQFNNPGTYLVRLEIEDCGGIDGALKSIVVIDPNAKPDPDFVSDVRTIVPGQTVRFYDRSTQAPQNWQWKITPGTITYKNGTDEYSQNPIISFNQVGNYDVKLIATNAFGTDSVLKTSAINVVEYCFPGAGLNTDLGITRVTFAGIDNVSVIGPQTYSDYSTSVKSAAVQKGTKYPITILRATNNEDMSRKVWIDYNGDGVFSANEEVAGHVADKSISWTDSIAIPTTVSEGSTRMRIGTSYGITNNSPCGVNPYGEFEDYTITIYENLTRPVITLIGSEVVNIEVGQSYSDSGATATDDLDGNLTANLISSTNLNTQVVGTYYYRYSVTDNNGNSAEETRIINVTPDITPPQITLLGNNPFNVVLGSQFVDPGATAVDNLDGVITSRIQVTGFVNSFQIGQYTLTYSVSDLAGNLTTDQRTVIVGDTTLPNIYLKGADTVYIALGAAYNDPGAIVIDNGSANLPYNVDLSVIDNTVVGDYTLTYTATDSSGNQALPVYRVVGVRDITAPMLTLLGDTVRMEVHTFYNEPGYLVSDNYDATVPVVISGSVDTAHTGLYLLIYSATDAGGNSSAVRYRIVQVMDTKAPVIELNGDKILTLCRWEKYTDPGYVVTDNYDQNIEVEVESNLNTSWEGLYSIRYTAEDEAGNKALAQERLIRVIACVTGIDDQEDMKLSLYPNPSTGEVHLRSETGFRSEPEILITDAQGKTVNFHSEKTSDEVHIDLGNSAPGIYFVRVNLNGNLSTFKIQLTR